MLKKEIKYEDFNGNTVAEVFYFNMSKSELIELESGGLGDMLRTMVDERNPNKMIVEFKRLILAAYGVKSEDGKRFIKNDTLREEFSQSAAFDALFMELSQNEGSSEAFIRGILPSDVQAMVPQDKPTTQPRPLPLPSQPST
jgi:hypothetical protein